MDKTDFIKEAINDTQSTIRAVDAKAAVLLTFLLLPISSIGKIWGHIQNIHTKCDPEWLFFLCAVIFFLVWGIAILGLLRTFTAIDNPVVHIKKDSDTGIRLPSGVFFSADIFKTKFWDVFFNRKTLFSTKSILEQLESYPNEKDIDSELTLEHLKLVYIREIKFKRFNTSLIFATVFFFIGSIIYVLSKFC